MKSRNVEVLHTHRLE